MGATEFSFAPLEAPAAPAPAGVSGSDAAAAVLSSAHAEAGAIRAMAHAEGLAAGRDAARAELAQALAALGEAAALVRAETSAAAERLEREAVDLALAVAGKVVGSAVAVEPGLVVEAIRGALRGIVERERITVLVNPGDLALVRGAMDELTGSLGGIEHADVQAERRVGRGGAVVRVPDGDVDARWETKLERAAEAVRNALGEA